MLLRRLTIAAAAAGLLGSPAATLYCPTDDPAAMACCERDANDCNRPGKGDDCCRTAPTDGQAPAVAAKAGGLAKRQPIVASVSFLPMAAPAADRPGLSLKVPPDHVLQDLPPPPLSVLRL
jgi:hypothetical protein